MAPTLLPGDQILVDKTLSPRNVQRRDIIVFIFPENLQKRFMHRVVGLPGEQIELRGEHLLIGGKQTREDYVLHTSNDFVPKRDNFAPVVVSPESFFVMGDNRDRSCDSRFWGPVHFEKVLGRAEMIYWSWDKENLTVRWGRSGKRIEQGSSG
jgi:signal peptidase I